MGVGENEIKRGPAADVGRWVGRGKVGTGEMGKRDVACKGDGEKIVGKEEFGGLGNWPVTPTMWG